MWRGEWKFWVLLVFGLPAIAFIFGMIYLLFKRSSIGPNTFLQCTRSEHSIIEIRARPVSVSPRSHAGTALWRWRGLRLPRRVSQHVKRIFVGTPECDPWLGAHHHPRTPPRFLFFAKRLDCAVRSIHGSLHDYPGFGAILPRGPGTLRMDSRPESKSLRL